MMACPAPASAGVTRVLLSLAGDCVLGGEEIVNIANNHYIDYGTQGRESTKRALQAAGIRFAGYGEPATASCT